MNYQRYFRPEQQLLLRIDNVADRDDRTELMTVYVVSSDKADLIVSLPYGVDAVDQYPFYASMQFEITSKHWEWVFALPAVLSEKSAGTPLP